MTAMPPKGTIVHRIRTLLGQAIVIGVVSAGIAVLLTARTAPSEVRVDDGELAIEPLAMEADVDACTLVTQGEAETALGSAVSTVPDRAQCTYVAGDASGRGVSVAAPAGVPSDSMDTAMQQVAEVLHGSLTVVSDVGEEGYVVTSDHLAQLMARQGTSVVVVVLTLPAGTPDQQVSTLSGLARTALGRM